MSRRISKHAAKLRHAISLEDRIELLKRSEYRVTGRQSARARSSLRRWSQLKPFNEGNVFAQRLRQLDLSEPLLVRALTMPASYAVREHLKRLPLWQSYIALAEEADCDPLISKDQEPESSFRGHEALLKLAVPLINQTLELLRTDLQQLLASGGGRIFDLHHALALMNRDMSNEVISIIQKTCLLELRIAKVSNQLSGSDGEERYESFIRRLATPSGRKRLFREYPLLLDALLKRLQMYRRNIIALLSDLVSDSSLIEKTFFQGHELTTLIDWMGGAGDSHRGGRSVIALTFDGDQKLIYKPRSLKIDCGFNQLIDWCNEKLPHQPLRYAKTINCGSHGWSEYVPHREAQTNDEVSSHFHRQGKFLALFYALHASDLHYDNMISCGADPIYVDLETLFHSQLFASDTDNTWSGGWPITVADTYILSSERVAPYNTDFDPDISIFGARPGQDMNIRALRLVGAGTDEAQLEVAGVTLDAEKHLLRLRGEIVDSRDFLDEIKSGFVAMYEMLMEERAFLLSAAGLDRYFAGAETRLVFRPTETYATFVQKSFHPDFMSDAVERRIFFERLFTSSTDPNISWKNTLLKSEVYDLQNLDVPYFSQQFEDSTIFDSRGQAVEGAYLPSPRETVVRQLKHLSQRDMHAQLLVIDNALASSSRLSDPSQQFAVSSGTLADGVSQIASALSTAAIERGADLFWICRMPTKAGATATPRALSLYDGQLGIALFLGAASRVLRRPDLAEAALASLKTVIRWSHEGTRCFPVLGAFNGVLGLPYVMANLGHLLNRKSLFDDAVEWTCGHSKASYRDGLDIMNGAAGAILFLGALLKRINANTHQSFALMRLMDIYASKLATTSEPQSIGVGWVPEQGYSRPLTGFSHGCAGFAAALYTASAVLSEPSYRELADKAILYENTHFSTHHKNWLDLRGEEAHLASFEPVRTHAMCAWCHGAPGILLGRSICLRAIAGEVPPNAAVLSDALQAADTTKTMIAEAAADNMSMCHGALGNIDILRLAAAHPQLEKACIVGALAEAIHKPTAAWRCGDDLGSPVLNSTAAPGLLIGQAGIGYSLLRYLAPQEIPSVLSLDVGPFDYFEESSTPALGSLVANPAGNRMEISHEEV